MFSWVVGAVLVALGMIGRKEHQTNDSLSGSQVEREGPAAQVHTNPAAAAELAEAERALALHYATEEQIERLHEADRYRTAADRVHAWEESDHRHGSPSAYSRPQYRPHGTNTPTGAASSASRNHSPAARRAGRPPSALDR